MPDNKKTNKPKAIGLLSGGLDSTLAVRVIAEQGYDVTAINFETHFCNCATKVTCGKTKHTGMDNIDYRKMFTGPEYLELVKNPPHGHGKNMNICIDCRIFMLKKAKEIMNEEGADFIFTGEVLGQRPMSQNRDSIDLIERESGLEGKLLRPLSAKKMKPTIAEQEGKLDREKLYGFTGRSRTDQMNLAKELGITEYPSPAGGCLLTDQEFAKKLRDALDHGEENFREMKKLKLGRHYRLEDGTKIIAGREDKENEILMTFCDAKTIILTVNGMSSTYCFMFGKSTEENRNVAGRIVSRYSKAKKLDKAEIKWWTGKGNDEDFQTFTTAPADADFLKKYKV